MEKADIRGLGVCLITGPSQPPWTDLCAMVTAALESGVRWLQYRHKDGSRREVFNNALRLRELTSPFNACLIINDHADIALAADADGVHLGQDDLPLREARRIMGGKIIGISTHSLLEACEAEKGGADYIGFGPVFVTTTKDAGTPKGVEALKRIVDSVTMPVIAIGGIKAGNLGAVMETGCAGVAVSSGILEGELRGNVQAFLSQRRR